MTPAEKLQALYDSEINFEISCFYDMGFLIKLGDTLNGHQAQAGHQDYLATVDEASDLLWRLAQVYYPKAKCFEGIK